MSTIQCTNPSHRVQSHVAGTEEALECILQSSQLSASQLLVPGVTYGGRIGGTSKRDTTTAKDLGVSRSEARIALGVESEQHQLILLRDIKFHSGSKGVPDALRAQYMTDWKKLEWNNNQGYDTAALFVVPSEEGDLVGFGTWNDAGGRYEADYKVGLVMFDVESQRRILNSMESVPRDQ